MAHNSWKKDRAKERIATRLAEVESVEIKDYVRDTDLNSLPKNTAYRVDGVHIYADIVNLDELLDTTQFEGETCHKRVLRFLNLHYRAVHRILEAVEAIEVDFHNQRLHAVVAKPYGDEATRIFRAVAIGKLIIDVLSEAFDEDDDEITPAAKVRVGIDSGVALAVRNGRRGHAEPLFLGSPANLAAKRAGGGTATGIYITNSARTVIGWDLVDSEDKEPLSSDQIYESQLEAKLPVDATTIVGEWIADLDKNPIGKFEFSGHTPPFSDLDLETLSPTNSRRQDAVSIYADIDGFTAYVAENVKDNESAKDVVRVLHVLRSEMHAVLSEDFGGLKIRFIGDCVHGVLSKGTAQTTDAEGSITTTILCAGGLRDSFDLALDELAEARIAADELGLAIGADFGPIALTRLGVKGSMIRCAIGRSVISSEVEQQRCDWDETALGQIAIGKAKASIRKAFGKSRKMAGLDYEEAQAIIRDEGGTEASSGSSPAPKPTPTIGASLLGAASKPSTDYKFPGHNATPTKESGFA